MLRQLSVGRRDEAHLEPFRRLPSFCLIRVADTLPEAEAVCNFPFNPSSTILSPSPRARPLYAPRVHRSPGRTRSTAPPGPRTLLPPPGSFRIATVTNPESRPGSSGFSSGREARRVDCGVSAPLRHRTRPSRQRDCSAIGTGTPRRSPATGSPLPLLRPSRTSESSPIRWQRHSARKRATLAGQTSRWQRLRRAAGSLRWRTWPFACVLPSPNLFTMHRRPSSP